MPIPTCSHGAVINEGAGVLGNRALDIADARWLYLYNGPGGPDQNINVLAPERLHAVRPWNLLVDFRDNGASLRHRRGNVVVDDTETVPAVLSGGTDLYESHVAADAAVGDVTCNLGDMARDDF